MGGNTETLRISAAQEVPPDRQRQREEHLLARARDGESHLHVSMLGGDLLAPGYFHATPPTAAARTWRRHTGGRAIAAGTGFLIATLALPHRSALVAPERLALRPEQVINRCVRGLIAWLRDLGLDPSYPGLDWLIVGHQRIAHLGFFETAEGPTLFQAVIGVESSLAESTLRLDRLDPEGTIPATLLMPDDCTTLQRALGQRSGRTKPADHLGKIAAGYAATFGLGVESTHLVDTAATTASPLPSDLLPQADAVRIEGKLGTVCAALRLQNEQLTDVRISGDLIARNDLRAGLRRALCGKSANSDSIAECLDDFLDGQEQYILGLVRAEIHELLARALAVAQRGKSS